MCSAILSSIFINSQGKCVKVSLSKIKLVFNIPTILLLSILILALFGHNIPLLVKEFIYTLSLTIKSLIIFILPILIFSLLFQSVSKLVNGATTVILALLLSICGSNLLTTSISWFFAHFVYNIQNNIVQNHLLDLSENGLEALWHLNLPTIITNNYSMLLALLLGLLSKNFPNSRELIIISLNKVSTFLLAIIKILIIPFILGFLVKIQHDKALLSLVQQYGPILFIIALAQFLYISSLYYLASAASSRKWYMMLRNMLPSALAGFSTMSSASAMPLTISAVERNAELALNTDLPRRSHSSADLNVSGKDLASSIIPATVNIHLIGDCLAIPIFAYAILKAYGMSEPNLYHYGLFAIYFVIAKFSVAAIPGGGIIVMLPILQEYLGFNGDMMSLITTLYILFDPVITCANVLGNGSFALIFIRFINPLVSKKKLDKLAVEEA